MERRKFEELIEKAYQRIPEKFKEKMENIVITVEDSPTQDDLANLKSLGGNLLLGLYRGTPLPQRSVWQVTRLPDKIILFQKNIEKISRSEKEIEEKINEVLLHEIAHYFGLTDREIYELMCPS